MKTIAAILYSFAALVLTGLCLMMAYYPYHSDAYLISRVVKLTSSKGQCSGEQVRAPSGKDYILTAGHCHELEENGTIDAQTEDGKHHKVRVIAEDRRSDLLLLQGIPHLRGIDIEDSAMRHDHVRTFTHGAGHATYKTEGELMETSKIEVIVAMSIDDSAAQGCDKPKNKVIHADSFFGPIVACVLSVDETASTAMTVPGSSGGMVVSDRGDLVGVVSAGDGHFSMFVPLKQIQRFLARR